MKDKWEEAIVHLSKDQILRNIIEQHKVTFDPIKTTLYESLISAIISQQLSTKAAATIKQRFFDLFHHQRPLPSEIIDTEPEILRAVGLSYQKIGYVKNVAQYFETIGLDDDYWETQSDEEIITELTKIKGLGIWTVQMILMFNLGRPDVFPTGDLIIKNSILKYYNINSSGKEQQKALEAVGEQWRPFRSIASLYLWKAKDNLK